MANGEGIIEEVVAKIIVDDSEVPKISESIDKEVQKTTKALKSYSQMLRGTRQEVLAVVKGQRAVGISAQTMAKDFMDAGRTQEIATSIMRQAGYGAKETAKAFKDLGPPVKDTAFSFEKMADAVKFAVFRFFTALIIYQALRKILRAINETITTSIRLWREFGREQQVLRANLEANASILGKQVGTFEEWEGWIRQVSAAYGGSVLVWTQATSALLQQNLAIGRTTDELKDLLILSRNVAIQQGLWKDEQPDIAKGVDLVMKAVQGEETALGKLGITQSQITQYARDQGIEWDLLTEGMQEAVRWSFIMTQRSQELGQAVDESFTDVAEASSKVTSANENLMISFGKLWAKLADGMRLIRLFVTGPIIWLITKAFELRDAWLEAVKEAGEWVGENTRLGQSLRVIGEIIDRLAPSFLKATDAQEELTDATIEGGKAALEAAAAWTKLQQAIAGLEGVKDKVKRIFDDVTGRVRQAAREGFEAAMDLGRSIGDAFLDNMRSIEDAARNFSRRMADITADLAQNIDRLNRRFIARAAELVLRAEERKEEIRKDFRQQEEEERDDLNLRLKHMEEDFLLDMKHMREDYEMDIEEAARARDARAIRTLQRRYGLEKRQRGEDYQLSRKQFIESWEQRHKQRQKDLDEELKEVEDNLAKQLEALERERQQELEELKIRARERRDELKLQYAQEKEDLKAALDRRLADILIAAVAEGTIRKDEALKVTNTLAILYGIDKQNLEDMVIHDLDWLAKWSSAWESAITGIAQARGLISGGLTGGVNIGKGPMGFAKGGMGIATSPTLIKVGEAGPELFTAIPLAKGGSVLGGLQSHMGGNFNLTIDGNQSGQWSPEFERGVERTVANIFREAFEE